MTEQGLICGVMTLRRFVEKLRMKTSGNLFENRSQIKKKSNLFGTKRGQKHLQHAKMKQTQHEKCIQMLL